MTHRISFSLSGNRTAVRRVVRRMLDGAGFTGVAFALQPDTVQPDQAPAVAGAWCDTVNPEIGDDAGGLGVRPPTSLASPPGPWSTPDGDSLQGALGTLPVDPGMRSRIANALASLGVLTRSDLRHRSVSEVSRAKGMGPKSVGVLIRAGLVFPTCPSDTYDHRRVEHEDLWRALGVLGRPHRARVYHALVAGRITTPGQLRQRSSDDPQLRRIGNLGERSVARLQAAGLLAAQEESG